MSIKCPKCQHENPDDTHYCGKCAAPLKPISDVSVTETIEVPKDELARGTIFASRYEIIEELGRGGMGRVYRAYDKNTEEEIALKLLRAEIASNVVMIKRFRNELRYARKLTHKNVCRMYDVNEKDGSYYITMEYVPGEDLKSFIRRTGKLSVERAITITGQICRGLEEAHNFGLVHRDLKPQNIMIDKEGNARIMDFGVAYSLEGEEITEAGVVIGTPKYMSPEQISGKGIDQRSDLYSVGIILYEMVTGRVPFEGETGISVAVKHRTEAPQDPRKLNSQIPEDFSRMILKCMEKEKENRYQSAKQILNELDKFEKDISSIEILTPTKKHASQKGVSGKLGGKKLLWRSVFFISVIFLGAAIFWFSQKTKPQISSEQILVLVADFQNQTTEKAFEGGALENLFGNGLKSAQFVSLYRRDKAQKLVNQLDPSAEGRLDGLWAQLVSRNEKISVIIDGSIIPIEGGYQINIWALDPISSEKMSEASEKIATRAEAFGAIENLEEKIRLDLQYHLFSSISTEAVVAYLKGVEFDKQGKTDEAKKMFLEAINIDADFGSAYAAMAGIMYQEKNLNEVNRYYVEAMKRIDSMSKREQYRVRGAYYMFNQNYQKAIDEYSELLKIYPADPSGKRDLLAAHANIAIAYFLGYRMQEAFEHGLKAIEFDPENLDYRLNQSWYALASGNFERAAVEARKTLEINPSFPKAYVVLSLLELAQDRPEEAVKIYGELEALSEIGATWACIGFADLALYQGRLDDAVAILNAGISADIEKNRGIYANPKYRMLAQAYLLQGKDEAAVEAVEKALELYGGRETQFAAAQIYIEVGQLNKARDISGELARQGGQDIYQVYAKLISGCLSLKMGDVTGALKLFDEANSIVDTWLGRFNLGRGYIEAGAYAEALSEFEKCQKRRAEALSVFLMDFPTFRYLDSLDYYMGRALEALKRPTAAGKFYTKFLEIKDNADPGIAEVEDARKRLAGLKGY